MKSFLFTAALCFAMLGVQAQSNLIIFSQEGESFWVILNGARQNEAAETNVKITGLTHPNYKLKVIFENDALGEIDKNLFLPEYAAEVTYNIKENKNGEKVVRYVSDVPIAQAPAPASTQTVRTYTSTARPAVTKQVTVTETRNGVPNNNVNVSVNTPMGGMSINVNDAHVHSSSTTTTTTTYTEEVVEEPAYVLPGYSGPVGCPMPMAQADFESAKNSIASKDWDETRLTIAKQIVGSNCLLSGQVTELVRLFEWEESKLDFAKFAYGRTYDLGNYFKVNNAFEWEASTTELNNYINSQR